MKKQGMGKASLAILLAAMVMSSVGGTTKVYATESKSVETVDTVDTNVTESEVEDSEEETATNVAEGETEDNEGEITSYVIGEKNVGTLDASEEVDVYSFTTDETDSFYEFEYGNTGVDGYVVYKIYKDADLMEKISEDDLGYKRTGYRNLAKLEKNHTYYVVVDGNNTGSYQFQITKAEDDVKDTPEEAETFAIGKEVRKILQNEKDVDCFTFTTDGSDSFYEYTYGNTGVDGYVVYKIYKDADLTEKIVEDDLGNKRTGYRNLAKLEKNHTYYVVVNGNNKGSYQFQITKAEDDVKDTPEEAEAFAIGKEVTKILQNEKDVDCFTFTTDGSDSFYEYTYGNTGVDGYVVYKIYKDADLTEKIVEDDLGYKRTGYRNLAKLEKNHTYYVVVNGNNKGSYQFKVTKAQDDVKDTPEGAEAFAIGKEVTKILQNEKDVDCFTFTTDGSDSFYEYTYGNTGVDGYVVYKIYKDADLTEKIVEDDLGYKRTGYRNLAKLEKNHTYYVVVNGNNKGSYQFKVTKAQDDVKDTVNEARKLSLNESKYFNIENPLDVDCFSFKTTGYVNYTLTFSNCNIDGNATIHIFSGKDCLDSQKVCEYSLGRKSSLSKNDASLKLKSSNTYYIKVTGEKGKYKLGVTATAPASVKVSKAGTKKVSITWKKVSNAAGYEVYRAQSKNGKYKKVTTIKKASTVKYTDKKDLKKGKTYYYKVRAYKKVNGKKCYTAFTSAKSVKVK